MTEAKTKVLKNEAIKEIIACHDDPVYFIEKYVMVQHPTRGLVPFKLYDYQKKSIISFISEDKVIVNKARQLGFTTLTAAFILWLILFHKNKHVLVVSIDAEVAKGLIQKVKVMLENIPDWMYLCDITTKRIHKIALSNGSQVESVARSDNAGRSKALSLLVIDEAALIKNMEEMWKGLKSTVSTGGKIIALSTPKGLSNWFHKTYSEAVAGINNWHPILVNWWECPEYASDLEDDENSPGGKTSSWFREFTKDMTTSQIKQELLTEFLETGDSYFDSATIKYWFNNTIPPERKEGADKALWIWFDPAPGHKYLIVADSSTGAGEDFSGAHVIDLNGRAVVAEYYGKVYPDIFGEILVDLAKRYNNAWIAPENQHVGSVTCYQIKNSGYENLVYLSSEFKLIDRWIAQYNGILPGVPNDVRNRPSMVAKLEEFCRKKVLKFFSKRLVNEMTTFSVINGKPQALKGCHDDLIMSLAIGAWLIEIIPEFNLNYNPLNKIDIYSGISIVKSSYDSEKINHQARIQAMKERFEEKGYQNLQPNIFNPYLIFKR